ncbi:beta-1,4-galactosyltransferase 7 [Episyrphus balteatus]|uniref:beta-1,4-galactosyltransferase 7 n=1 Tax=Episyrphus balteatus TaxID=286459 RepID=UPI0024858205|nr:beta-1,4-galactosyltransferase 7 [Episyrphus balteatus]
MNTHSNLKLFLICGLCLCTGGLILLSILPLNSDCDCPNNIPGVSLKSKNDIPSDTLTINSGSTHKLAILVPFRDRFDELLQFVPHITDFLRRQNVNHHIFVLNQVDRYRFNRASLINVGFLFTKLNFDHIAMHDVDLLPNNDKLIYKYPEKGPHHIASPEFHPKYHYETFVGGVLLVKREHFQLMNGMSNRYWGWGLEDDEFYVRIKDAELEVTRPKNIGTGVNDTFRHIHNRLHRKRDTQKCFNQKEVTRKRDRQTGLDTLQYNISGVTSLTINAIPITVVNIILTCDMKTTPWCDCSGVAAAANAPT